MSDTQPDKLIIEIETAEAIANYLAQRPYIEVWQLIAKLQQLQPLPAPDPGPVKE